MKFRTALLAATVAVAAPTVASAQVVDGFYVGGGLGLNLLQDVDLGGVKTNAGTPLGNVGGSIEFNAGFVGLGSVGYGFGNGLRLEVEGNYRVNAADGVRGFSIPAGLSAGGDATQYGIMANILFDFDLGWGIVPYLGAGAGYAWLNLDQARLSGGGTNIAIDDTQGGFAYQAIVGAAIPIEAVPGLSITGEFRFFSITGLDDFETRVTTTTVVPNTVASGKVGVDDTFNYSFLIGARYAFGVAPPPPAPAVAPAPAPARTFLVFFDFAQSTLTDRARSVIAEAANAARTTQTTRIEVSGNTDTVGSAQYNQGLSMRRAESVAGELERRGIPRSEMVLQAFGFTRLLVPTGPNVREPQNRRVEIVLR
ncbi:MAG: OmpA family protein [Acetobacteraceae bacterium]|nr:OmpA family protein [Acetobacteraceae bacterium]